MGEEAPGNLHACRGHTQREINITANAWCLHGGCLHACMAAMRRCAAHHNRIHDTCAPLSPRCISRRIPGDSRGGITIFVIGWGGAEAAQLALHRHLLGQGPLFT
jgi:hypothetical protein